MLVPKGESEPIGTMVQAQGRTSRTRSLPEHRLREQTFYRTEPSHMKSLGRALVKDA